MKRQQPKPRVFGYDPATSLQQFVLLFDSGGSARLEEWFEGDQGDARREPDLKATISSCIWAAEATLAEAVEVVLSKAGVLAAEGV